MKNRSKDSEVIRTIRLIHGRSADETTMLLEDFGIYAVLCYLQGGKAVLPFVGEITFHRDGDGLRCGFKPSEFLTKNIGQIEDGGEADFESALARKFRHVLKPEQEHRKCAKTERANAEAATEAQDGPPQLAAAG